MRKLLLILPAIFMYCGTITVIQTKTTLQTIYLTDHKILIKLPINWNIYFSSRKYFHLFARDGNNILGPRIEYRGLLNTTKNNEERDQYAKGWYKAIELNFPNWKYLGQKNYQIIYRDSSIYTYEFEGTFQDGNLIFKKIGFLRIYKDQIHAIYYTALESEFDKYLNTFLMIDKSIIYNPLIASF